MEKLKTILSVIWPLLLSVFVGVLLYRLSSKHLTDEFILPLVATTCIDIAIVVHLIKEETKQKGAIFRGKLAEKVCDHLARCYKHADDGNPFVHAALTQIVQTFNHNLEGLSDRHITDLTTIEFDAMSFAFFELVGASRRKGSIYAISMNSQGNFWQTKEGQRYESLNFDAAESGASIKRIFLVQSPDQEKKMQVVLDRHKKKYQGVKMIRAYLRETEGIKLRDFAIFNEQVYVEFNGNIVIPQIDNISVSFDPEKCQLALRETFWPLWNVQPGTPTDLSVISSS